MPRSAGLLSALALSTLVRAAAAEGRLPNVDAYFDSPMSTAAAPLAARRPSAAPAIVTATDPLRGVPTFAWAPRGASAPPPATTTDPERAARFYLSRYADLYGLSADALAAARLVRVHDTGHGGIIVVLRQAMGGVELFHHDAKVLLDRSMGLIALSGSLHPAARAGIVPGPALFRLDRRQALARAFEDLQGFSVPASSFGSEQRAAGGYHTYELSPGPALLAAKVQLSRPARVKEVFFPLPDRIVPGYYLEILAGPVDGTDAEGHAWVIAADDGRLLYRADLVQSEAYKYRVWAEQSGNKRPLDGPIADFTPSPSGVPDDTFPPFIAPSLITMDGFNKNPGNQADSWLWPGSTEAVGNNVDAYTDLASPDGYSNGDLRATTTSENTFDRVYDVTQDPLASPEQSMAAVTQLFYTNNWLHDYWYDSGFDEAAGNAQRYNGGRGGLEGDELHAEAQDGALEGNLDNANMYTPADGDSPRMQMYIWSGPEQRSLTVSPLGKSLPTAGSDFGQGTYDVEGQLILAIDGTPSTADACEPLVNDVAGKILLVHRGSCTFKQKAVNAEAAGAIAILIANNQPGAPPFPAGDDPENPTPVTIPVMAISMADGEALEAALASGPVTATLTRAQGVRPDGTIDSPIIAHEWGHYLHHRLVECNTLQCGGQSEGWGDFLALTLMVRKGDDLQGTYASTIYAVMGTESPVYYGLRRVPYSVDTTKNSFTFKHIADGEPLPEDTPILPLGWQNSEVHNTGEVWTNMLFEGYVGLLERSKLPDPPYSFEQARRRMADYVVAGMALAPPQPTFNEQRDALLAAAFAEDPEDMLVLAKGFTKRGLGSCAVSPPKSSPDNTGLVESFELQGALQILSMKLDDSLLSCDSDGLLDATEKGRVTFEIANAGVVPLANSTFTLTTATPGITITSTPTAAVDSLAPFSTTTLSFDVALDGSANAALPVSFTLEAKSAGSCTPTITRSDTRRINYDEVKESSATDTFDSSIDVWTPKGEPAKVVWSKVEMEPLDSVWHGADLDGASDTWLESPPLTLSSTEPFVVHFEHRYEFERGPEEPGGPEINWDGGLIEVSTNGGKVWKDINLFGDPGYGGVITSNSGNPLSNRMAYVGTNASWPMMDKVTLDLGQKLAGTTILLRFRIGSDDAVGTQGWDIDDVRFEGLTTKPFPSVESDGKVCNRPPVAVLGPSRTVLPGAAVLLDASKSSDPDGDPLSFTWTQLEGPTVEIESAGAKAIFVAPSAQEDAELGFEVTVSDGTLEAKAQVQILVRKNADGTPDIDADDLVGSGGCACEAGGKGAGSAWLPAWGAAVALLGMRRRRGRR
jgi:hypothetical protein